MIFSGLSPPCLGCRVHGFYGDAFDFLKGIGSDGYAGKWDTRVFRDAFRRDFNSILVVIFFELLNCK